jgi:type VI secretion system protein ImpK
MDDQFARLVDPIIKYVIDTLKRIAGPRAEQPDVDEVHKELVSLIQRSREAAAAADRSRDYTRLAERALVYWADEVLINSGWEHAETWREHKLLEKRFYNETVAGDEFFVLAEQARIQSRDALETFFLCLALGFQGRHASGGTQVGSPLERLGAGTYRLVRPQLRRFLPDEEGAGAPGESVPLPGTALLLRVSALTFVTVLASLAGWIMSVYLPY